MKKIRSKCTHNNGWHFVREDRQDWDSDIITVCPTHLTGVLTDHIIEKRYPDKLDKAVDFGNVLMKEYRMKNLLRGYTTAQILALSSHLSGLQGLASIGSIPALSIALSATAVTTEFTQADKDDFSAKITAWLAAQV